MMRARIKIARISINYRATWPKRNSLLDKTGRKIEAAVTKCAHKVVRFEIQCGYLIGPLI